MYLAFPFFGLGQGAFYRLSVVPEFSGSELLVSMGGDGVHNEFLRILVELGPVGLGLLLFIAIPFVRLGRQNLQLVSFYALAGIALGSVYTNALLVRELLLLCAVLAGSYFWEAQSTGSARWRPPASTTTRYAAVALATLVLAALIEVALSFGRFPFTYGQRCLEVRPLGQGWVDPRCAARPGSTGGGECGTGHPRGSSGFGSTSAASRLVCSERRRDRRWRRSGTLLRSAMPMREASFA